MTIGGMNYDEFIKSKAANEVISGFDPVDLKPHLFDFQRAIVEWACKRGRAAIFADTGLGKTAMQSEWARQVAQHTGGRVLILAPLCVAQQTVEEEAVFGTAIKYCRSESQTDGDIIITNYEMVEHFDVTSYAGIVLDESSILKGQDSKTRAKIIEMFRDTPYKLSCTATPSPNDHMELGNQAEFLGVMTATEMLAMFFVHDGGDTSQWRLKGHGKTRFWEWMAKWSVCVRNPADLGFNGDAYILPGLELHEHVIESPDALPGQLFSGLAQTLTERRDAKRQSKNERILKVVQIIQSGNAKLAGQQLISKHGEYGTARANKGAVEAVGCGQPGEEEGSKAQGCIWHQPSRLSGDVSYSEEPMRDLRIHVGDAREILSGGGSLPRDRKDSRPALYELQPGTRKVQGQLQQPARSSDVFAKKYIVWCHLNTEQDQLAEALKNAGISAVSIQGSTPLDHRVEWELLWRKGSVQVLISKPSVFGWGMNWQHCHDMVFAGLNDSFESYYQAIRRCYRFGQKHVVDVHLVSAESEGAVKTNLERKQAQANDMAESMVAHMRELTKQKIIGSARDDVKYLPQAELRIPSWIKTDTTGVLA